MVTRHTIGGLNYRLEYPGVVRNKPLCLFLHGFMGSSADFYHIIPELTDFVNPVLVDLPGHGETGNPAGVKRCQTHRLVSDILTLVSMYSSQQVFLAGYSMGGRLALHTVLARPDLFRGIILESTSTGIADEQLRMQRRETDAARAGVMMENLPEFVDEWNAMPMFQSPGKEPATRGIEMQLNVLQKLQSPEGLAAMLEGFGAGSMPAIPKENLKQLRIPAMLIAGSYDSRYVEIQKQMAEYFSDARVEIIPNSAHRVHIDAPDAYIGALRSYFENSLHH